MKNFVFVVVVLNLIYEIIEIVFPIKKMSVTVRSFTLVVMLCALIENFSAVVL